MSMNTMTSAMPIRPGEDGLVEELRCPASR